jgi:pyruvate kinase
MKTRKDIAHTKIVCTLCPASDTKDKIIALLEAGMSIIRLNFSHGTYEKYQEIFDTIKEIRIETNYIFGVALDT